MGNFQFLPDQASTLAPEVDHLLYFLIAVTVFFSVLIFGAIFYFAIRYRRRSTATRWRLSGA
jgi:cytochrome c oxidase subunit 2